MTDADIDHETWADGQEETTVTVDGHEVEMAYRDSGSPGAAGSSSGQSEATSSPRDASSEGRGKRPSDRASGQSPQADGGAASPPRDAGNAEPVVFLHGIPTWGYLWRRVSPPLAAAFRTVVPDLVGYGNSSMREGFDRSIRAQEAALSALLDSLGLDRVHLVGHDIGAGVALRYAAHEPDRVGKLVVSNGVCYDSWPVSFISDLGLPDTADMDPGEFEGTLDAAFADGTYGEADPAFVEGMKAPWLRTGGRRALARAAVATNTNHTTEIPYDAIDADLLCLWGADDVMQPLSYGERLAREVGGRVVELDEAYHWVVEDRPAAYRERLRGFLTETDT